MRVADLKSAAPALHSELPEERARPSSRWATGQLGRGKDLAFLGKEPVL